LYKIFYFFFFSYSCWASISELSSWHPGYITKQCQRNGLRFALPTSTNKCKHVKCVCVSG